MNDLEKLRKEIDKVDAEIVEAVAARTNITYSISKYKVRHNINVVDEKREAEVYKKIRALARKNYIEEDFAEDLYKLIIAYCRDIQKLKH